MARGKANRSRGRRLGLLLLALLVGFGAWNYQRNLAAERAEVRPYRTLSDADLAALVAAVETEVSAAARRYERARSAAPPAGPPSGDRWGAFERAQRHGRTVRALGSEASGHEAMLAQLRQEQARRAGEGDALQRFLRRAFRVR